LGNQAALTNLGIPTLIDLPSVGRNATDHPSFSNIWSVNSAETLESISQNATRFIEVFEERNR
ncbi:hypothetical protein C8R43DRAFT_893063, partial [Mycena crocata]